MRGRRLPWKAVPAAALAGSQLGHLLVYALRLGPEGLAATGTGAHAYLPSLATALAGLGGGAFLGVLVVLAAARILATRRGGLQRFERPPVLDLMAVIFAAQLTLFAVQETAEAVLTGRTVPTAGDLLLWGTLGQLPIAALAALALSWLTAGLRIALQDLTHARASARLTASVSIRPVSAPVAPALVIAWSPGRRLLRRGPPGPAR
ncbi:hypothetical protein [Candidatus Nephthysia bennettiae]|uniref:Uncharacterized protein n=1 Tax=Candidatus Nephthysia bennettiae TaxID=3127016 RepID=A0A934K099_9BACT|nr:hypothetical protein [Candidatus Dormibacteraeota bacterium]MBJ7612696.1 hypothetical protein [Candidatus Dormibacteraeota bacterium]